MDEGSEATLVLWTVVGGEVATWTLREGRSVDVGRTPQHGLQLAAPEVAEHAVRLSAVGGRLRVERLGTASVLLNGVQVSGIETARAGDVLTLGSATIAVGLRTESQLPAGPRPLPADLFEPALEEAIAAAGGTRVALFLAAPGARGDVHDRVAARLPPRSRVFLLGRAIAVLIDAEVEGLETLAREQGLRVALASVGGQRAEALLASLFEAVLGDAEAEPVFADPATLGIAQVVSLWAMSGSGVSCTVEGEAGVGKRLVARWALGVGAERVVRWDEGGRRKISTGGRWLVEHAAPPGDEVRALVEEARAQVLFVVAPRAGEPNGAKAFSGVKGALWIPPLRDRPLDVEPLVDWCVVRARRGLGRPELTLSPAVREALGTYAWPGNLDELEAAVLRACVVATSDMVGVRDLPARLQGLRTGEVSPLREAMAEQERGALLEALAQTRWNVTKAAELLALPRRTVVWRMARLGLRRPRDKK